MYRLTGTPLFTFLIFSCSVVAAALPVELEPEEALEKASVGGKYQQLLKKIKVEEDHKVYSEFRDWGRSTTAKYAGHEDIPRGYWVYVYPHWYIWQQTVADQGVVQLDQPPAGLLREQVLFADQAIGAFNRQGGLEKGRAWGPEQAAGPPDTPNAGDITTAWASLTQDGQEEWLELSYAEAVIPTEVVIHETFKPGPVYKMALFTDQDNEHIVWEGDDPTPENAARGVSKIKLDTRIKTQHIRVYLKSQEVAGWNEIDAVGLVGKGVEVQWAEEVQASSTFAEQPLAQPIAFQGGFGPVGGFNQQPVDEQLRQLVEDREKQMAKLLKKLREKDKQLDQQAEQFTSERTRFGARLKSMRDTIERLKAENERLRQRSSDQQP